MTSRNPDPHPRSLEDLLEAHVACEQLRARRLHAVHALAAVGAVVWIIAIWPAALPRDLRICSLGLWACAGTLTLFLAAAESVQRARLARSIAAQARRGES